MGLSQPIGATRMAVEEFSAGKDPGHDRRIREPLRCIRPARGFSFSAIRQSLPSTRQVRGSPDQEPSSRPQRHSFSAIWGRRSTGGPLFCKQPMSVRFRPSPPIRGHSSKVEHGVANAGMGVRCPLGRSNFGRWRWCAGAPYKRARSGGLPGTGGIVTLGGYQSLCGKTQGQFGLISRSGRVQLPVPQLILPSWRSWCARPVEGGEDAVQFGGSARGACSLATALAFQAREGGFDSPAPLQFSGLL